MLVIFVLSIVASTLKENEDRRKYHYAIVSTIDKEDCYKQQVIYFSPVVSYLFEAEDSKDSKDSCIENSKEDALLIKWQK